MFRPTDFIDCSPVREYNKNTVFTPMEQALIIYYSHGTTVEAKLHAWCELLDHYDEDAFLSPYHAREKRRTNRKIVSDAVKAFECALSRRSQTGTVVFKAGFYEKDYPNSVNEATFSTYDNAFEFIRNNKQIYFNDDALKDVVCQAEIEIVELDMENHNHTVFHLNNELQMTKIDTDACDAVLDEFDDFFLYLPLPYKKGDILKTTYANNGQPCYGVVRHDIDGAYFSPFNPDGDASDMNIGICYYDSGSDRFDVDNADFLKLDVCQDDELPDDQTILLLLREVYRGTMDFAAFLQLHSLYGKNAYLALYGSAKSK